MNEPYLNEVKFGDQGLAIGLTEIEGSSRHDFARLFYVFNGTRHVVDQHGMPLLAFGEVIDETLISLSECPKLPTEMEPTEIQTMVTMLYCCKYVFPRSSRDILASTFGLWFDPEEDPFNCDIALGVSFPPNGGAGDCCALVNLGDKTAVVGLSAEHGMLYVEVSSVKVKSLLNELNSWIQERSYEPRGNY